MAKCTRLGCLSPSEYIGLCKQHGGVKPEYKRKVRSHHSLYNTGSWRRSRKSYIQHHPLCMRCKKYGMTTASTDVDHIIPHRGDPDLFYDINNWQALCHSCHAWKTQREGKIQDDNSKEDRAGHTRHSLDFRPKGY